MAAGDTLASGGSSEILPILVLSHIAAVVVRCRLASVAAVASGHAGVGIALAVLGVV